VPDVETDAAPARRPPALDGLRVLEIGEQTAGPYAAKLLADYGAEVVKVEPPGLGDPTRSRGPFPGGQPDRERSGLFLYLNTNKRGIALDLSQGGARPILARLIAWADVLVTNLAPARLDAAGLWPAALRSAHPGLIVTTITPFGLGGPYAARQGDELISYAMGGIAYSTPGMPDAAEDLEREPPLHPAAAVAETIAGTVAATATLLVAMARERTAVGCHVDVSQQAAVACMQQRDVTSFSYTGVPYQRTLNPSVIGRIPNFYLPCQDGYVALAAPMDHQWDRLVEAMGRPEWALADDYRDAPARSRNWAALRMRLIGWTMGHTGHALYELAGKLRLPFFPLYALGEMVESDHVRERGSLVDVDRDGTRFTMPGRPVHMHGSPWGLRRPAPRLGEHTWEVLHDWLAYEPADIRRLAAAGVI